MKSAFFRNAMIFALDPAFCRKTRRSDGREQLDSALAPRLFQEGTGGSTGLGWVRPTEFTDELCYAVDDFVLLTMRVERKVLPAAVVKREAAKRLKELEHAQGYKPGRKQCKEVTEEVRDALLAKAPSVFRDTRVMLDCYERLLVIDTGTRAVADAVINLLARSLPDPFPVETLYTKTSPVLAMTQWVAEDEAPDNFTIDQDATFQAAGESKAQVKYTRLSLDAEDTRKHVQAGRQCTRLALTWADRVSFVLTEGMALKSIKPLDVLKEDISADDLDAQERFDSDLLLFGREFRGLALDLIDGLGGQAEDDL